MNPFGTEGKWYKGNLHTHTTNSDGDLSPEETANWYKKRGYDFLAITDHWKISQIEESSSKFLFIKGVEIGVQKAELGQSYHLVCLDISDVSGLEEEVPVQEAIDIVKRKGGDVILGHPYWSFLTINDLILLKGILGMEVFNSCCDLGIGKGLSSVHWDDILIRGKRPLGFAVDDAHHFTAEPFDAGKGWIMVKAETLNKENILQAIKEGNFYSSCGPVIKDITLEGNNIKVSSSPAKRINFVCNDAKGKVFRAEEGKFLNEVQFSFQNGVDYVRVECIDEKGKVAWSNPFFLT